MSDETVRLCVNAVTIESGDLWKIIEPVLWTGNIYDGPEEYEISLQTFSAAQRFAFAVIYYCMEINNGGHDQFYSNSTGIVWKDALAAFQAFDLPEFASILRESTNRIGGAPSLDRRVRAEQLNRFTPDFHDLDEQFYDAEKVIDLDSRMVSYIRTHPADFYFDGMIRRS